MKIQLSDHFTYRRLLRFVISPILMMMFTSLYSIVDGFFVSNFVGKTAFAAVNLMMPIDMGIGTIGFMIGSGGSAAVSRTLGMGERENANRYFTMLVTAALAAGVLLSALAVIFTPQLAYLLGARDELLEQCIRYGRVIFAFDVTFILQNIFQSFFVTAEKPQLSLRISVLAGLTNAVLDVLFIVVFDWGVGGAALATGIGQTVGGVIPLFYFLRKNSSLLHFTKTRMEGTVLLRACSNGVSELVNNISMSAVSILYNFQLMRLAGEDGVAAYGIIMYVNFVFVAMFIGYSVGTAPIIGYHYGADNHAELKNLFRKGLTIMGSLGGVMAILAAIFARPLISVFAGYDVELFEMTCHGFRLYSLGFVIMGINFFASAFFTALNNGAVSAVISFLRTFVFQVSAVLLLPMLFGLNGIWLAIVAAEILALGVSTTFFIIQRKRYHYA